MFHMNRDRSQLKILKFYIKSLQLLFMEKSITTIMMTSVMSFVITISLISATTEVYSQQENQQQEKYVLLNQWGSEGEAAGQFS